ncbi:MAG: AAA domain-containing protein, partial [Desulfuromonadales bacterium]|nr:AAA domain-containing protein [Desulfuromonadales bacterium]NIS39419.1 AAA domain-containing protein [Desulfuromonadales bacterium]
GYWAIRQVSEPLAAALGSQAGELLGGSLRQAFRRVTPPLWDLADEVVAGEEALQDIPVRLGQADADLLLEAAPGGLAEDYTSPLVYFRFYRRQAGGPVEGAPARQFGLVGSSPGMLEVFRKIGIYAESDAAVLVTGETGTGKELIARALHDQGGRRRGPFVAVNCSAISDELLESELFGHEKGAFTGAQKTHRGRFERADGGTIFLDEIGDMPMATQAKLLRVLEAGRIERVGSEQEIPVDVRIVCATNVPLEEAVGRGVFRSDLYHRVAVLRIHLPPLRLRLDDLPQLIRHFIDLFNRKYEKNIKRLTPEAEALLQSYLWPGNVRELRNVLERVFVEADAEVIGARAFAEWVRERQDFSPGDWGVATEVRTPPAPPVLASYEPTAVFADDAIDVSASPPVRKTTQPANLTVEAIRRAYRQADGNLAAAARLLGVHRATLYRYLDRHNISRQDLQPR